MGLCAVLLVFFSLSTALNVANPIWEAIDEPGHFQYVKFVAEQHRLPGKDDRLPVLGSGNPNCAEIRCLGRGRVSDQPPLYYSIEAIFVAPIDLNQHTSWVANPYFTWPNYPLRNGAALHTLSERMPYQGMVLGVHVMRAVSALMGLATLAAIYITVLSLTASTRVSLLVAAAAALAPGFLLLSASVTNDNAAVLTSSLALMCGVKMAAARKHAWRWIALYGVCTWLAMESKADAIFLGPAGVVFVAVWWLRQRASLSPEVRLRMERFSAIGLGLCAAAALAVPLSRRTITAVVAAVVAIPGDIRTAEVTPTCHCNTFPLQPLWGAIPNLWQTYWGSFGWETFHLPDAYYYPFLLLTLAAVTGMAMLLIRAVRGKTPVAHETPNLLALLASFLILLGIVLYRNIITQSDGGTTHVRFLLPALAATSTFLVLGLLSLPKGLREVALGGLFAACLSVTGYAVWTLPDAFVNIPTFGDLASAGAREPLNVDFATGMRLAGANLPDQPVVPGQAIQLTLFWQASRNPDFDYSAFVRLNDGHGTIVHDADHGPGVLLGRLPHQWQPGETVPDGWTIHLPASVPSGTYTVEVGLYDYRDMKPIVDSAGDSLATIGQLTVTG